jgi:GNAT superfamily N-acetyltransferase
MGFNVQKATEKDIVTIQTLANKIWHAYYPAIITKEQIDYMLNLFYSYESLSKQMADNQVFYLIYEEENPVGYASVSTTDGKSWFLHKLYLLPNLHGKGIGKQFLHKIEAECRPETMELTVNRQNFKSINFYFREGFKIIRVEDFDIGENYQMNDFIMRKVYI